MTYDVDKRSCIINKLVHAGELCLDAISHRLNCLNQDFIKGKFMLQSIINNILISIIVQGVEK